MVDFIFMDKLELQVARSKNNKMIFKVLSTAETDLKTLEL